MIDLSTFLETLFSGRETTDQVCLSVITDTKRFWNTYYTPELLQSIEQNPGAWYVCGSTVLQQNPPRRRLEDCTALWCVLLDDIGTKVVKPPEIVPSVRMETSQGNEQWLYFVEPYDLSTAGDLETAQGYLRELAETGYTDKASKSVSRIFRVPGSVNLKPGRGGFQTRVIEWNPDHVWDLDALMSEFGISKSKKTTRVESPLVPSGIEWPEDPILTWLQSRGRLGEIHGDWYDIECPWAHDHSTGETKAGYSPLSHGRYPIERGFQCFHEHCTTKHARELLAWVYENGGPSCDVVGAKEFAIPALKAALKNGNPDDRMKLLIASLPALHRQMLPDVKLTEKGIPKDGQLCTRGNIISILNVCSMQVRHNILSRETEFYFLDPTLDALALNSDDVYRALVDGCQKLSASVTLIDHVLEELSFHRSYHPMAEWITGVKWDGRSRLEELLNTVEATSDSVLWPTYLRKWLIQCVQACCGWENPQQMSSVLTLVGPEGILKSKWLEALVPSQFFLGGVSLHLSGFHEKDSIMRATQRPIVELGEVDTTFTRSDIGALRAFLTKTIDSYRIPHAKKVRHFPRATSYCATVNRMDFLTDPEGSRRFWPVGVTGLVVKHGIDLRQLWAEAFTWWESGEQWWLTASEEKDRIKDAEAYTFIPSTSELVLQWLAEHSDDTTEIMNASKFCERINVAPNNQNVRQIRDVLRRRLGHARRLKNFQNSWLIPTAFQGHIKGVVDEKRRSEARKEVHGFSFIEVRKASEDGRGAGE